MSRIGNLPITIKKDVQIEINGQVLKVIGQKGEIILNLPSELKIEKNDSEITLKRSSDDKRIKSIHGLWRMLIYNAVVGVSEGWQRKLDFKGVGFKAEVQGNKLILSVGFSHTVEIIAPEKTNFEVTKNIITVSGIDKQVVGQAAAQIRKVKPVEPYKGKGIKYLEEVPRKKLGKAAKTVTTATG